MTKKYIISIKTFHLRRPSQNTGTFTIGLYSHYWFMQSKFHSQVYKTNMIICNDKIWKDFIFTVTVIEIFIRFVKYILNS